MGPTMRFPRLWVFLAALTAASPVFAQQAILQGGPVTPGHVPQYTGTYSQPIVQDGGGSGGGGLGFNPGEFGITSRAGHNVNTAPFASNGNGPLGEHACMFDGPTNNPTGYHYLCFDPNAQGGGLIDYGNGGGASPLPLQISVNGILYQFPYAPTAPTVTNNAALRALAAGASPYVTRAGYAAPGDAPPLLYVWQTSCPGTADNLALYVAPTAGGAGCWSAAASAPQIYDTREWGAVNDSGPTTCGTNNSPAVQAEVTALGAGVRLYNDGWSCLKAQINITAQGEGIACRGGWGGGGGHDVGVEFNSPSGFVAGTYGMTLFQFKSSTTQVVSGWSMDCVLSGNTQGASPLGFIAVDYFSSRRGSWRVTGAHFSTSIVQADINTGLSEAAGNTLNELWINGDQSAQYDGSNYICNGTAAWDCSQNIFYEINGNWAGANPQVVLNGSDSETFFSISGYDNKVGGTLACEVKLSAANLDTQTARNNMFYYIASSNAPCPVYAEGTENGKSVASHDNDIMFVDIPNSDNPPSVGTGARLYWASLAKPIGTQNYYKALSATAVTDSYGLSTQTGVIGPVSGNSNATANLTFNLATGCQSANIQPTAPTTGHVVSCVTGSPTVLTIHNDTATSSYFYYTVIGY